MPYLALKLNYKVDVVVWWLNVYDKQLEGDEFQSQVQQVATAGPWARPLSPACSGV